MLIMHFSIVENVDFLWTGVVVVDLWWVNINRY